MGWFSCLIIWWGRKGRRCGDTKLAASWKFWRVVEGEKREEGGEELLIVISLGGRRTFITFFPGGFQTLQVTNTHVYLSSVATVRVENSFEKWRKSRYLFRFKNG